MLYLVLMLLLYFVSALFLRNNLGLSGQDVDIMFVGICGASVLEAIARIIVGIVAGAELVTLVAYFLSGLFPAVIGYIFFKRSGL